MKILKKILLSIICGLVLILAFTVLVVLVGPFLIAALFVEMAQEEKKTALAIESLVSGERQ